MIKDVVPQKFSPLDRALGGGGRKMRGGTQMQDARAADAHGGGRKMRGGTGSRLFQGSEPSSLDVQMRAGLGN